MSKNPKGALGGERSPIRKKAFERPGLTEDEIEEIREAFNPGIELRSNLISIKIFIVQ